MDNLQQIKDELLEAVKEPERQNKTPSNWALSLAIVFANLVFLLLDVISAITVYWMTNNVLYGILTGMAGFIPLTMHEALFVRAYASKGQKIIAGLGAIIALISIVAVGALAGVVNIIGVDSIGAQNAEIATIIMLIIVATGHALLAAGYFYSDSGIRANQQTAQAIARAIHQGELIRAGDYILSVTRNSVTARNQIADKHGSPAALGEVLRQLGLDKNHNGIPDFMEKIPAQKAQYNQAVEFSPNGHNENPTNGAGK